MKLKKPSFWDIEKPNIIAIILKPFSKLYEIAFKFKKNKKKKFNGIKTICIGNIYIGGTGKTSLAIKIKEILDRENISSCFIKKFHKNQKDEQLLLEKYGRTFVAETRQIALEKAILEKYEFAIFDDGLQDASIKYDYSFVCFNKINGVGNGLTIPAGPLRENIDNLKLYNDVFLNGNEEDTSNIKTRLKKINPNLNIYESKYVTTNSEVFNKNEKYLVFSGIGNHKTFLFMLKNENFNICHDIEFPDHYDYKKKDLDKIFYVAKENNLKILTTEKDYLRLNSLDSKKIYCIKSKLIITDQQKINNILEINNEKN